jgi:integrase
MALKIKQKDGLYRRGNSWFIRVRVNGEQIRKSFGPNKAQAEAALNKIKSERALGRVASDWSGVEHFVEPPKQNKTFAEAAEDYMEGRANYKHSSISSYQSILRRYLLPNFGEQALTEINDAQIRKFQVALAKSVSPSRVNTVLQLFRSILEDERRQGAIGRNPSESVRRMQEAKTDVNPLSERDLELALASVDEHYQPLFTVLAFTGARPNEIIALRWSDIDWRNEYIEITKGRVRGEEGLPKTKSAERKIPMSPRVIEALKKQKGRDVKSIDDYVFTRKNGEPIDKHLDRIWARALRTAGLSHRPSYQLRHTFATQCIINGLPLPYLARVLGHSTIDTLIRHYAGWIDSATSEQDQKLKASFGALGSKRTKPKR